MTDLLTPLLTLLVNYGYPVVSAVVLAGSFGIPVPTNTIVIAAGSFTVDNTLNIYILILVAALTATIGDIIGYMLARRYSGWVPARLLGTDQTMRAQAYFARWGVWSVFFTRFLLTPLAVPINLVAGISHYSWKKFSLVTVIGELIWAGIYISIGNIFGANWASIVDYISHAPTIATLLVIGVVSGYIARLIWRSHHQPHF